MPASPAPQADDSSTGRHLLVLTDATGEILWRVGSREALGRADRLEFSEGADWPEAGIGTNAIIEALVTGGPVQLFSAEHRVRTRHEWACTAAPITDPLTGALLGVLDVSGPLDTLSADTLRMVRSGGGVTAGNVRRRHLLGWVAFRGCVPAECAPAWCCGFIAGAALRQARRGVCRR